MGQDQLRTSELAREVVRRMNHLYGPVFPEPQALLAEFPLVLGPDNRKMSRAATPSRSGWATRRSTAW